MVVIMENKESEPSMKVKQSRKRTRTEEETTLTDNKKIKSGISAEKRDGDWSCGVCGMLNFASRSKCMKKKCTQTNPLLPRKADEKKGEWKCVGCGQLNLAQKTKCMGNKCNRARHFGPDAERTGAAQTAADWTCSKSGCGWINFGSRDKCKKCSASKGVGDVSWSCNCGYSNFCTRTICKSCGEKICASVVEYRVSMAHMKFNTTVADVEEFFLPLEPESVKLWMKDGKPLGKANVYFKTHEEAVKAMEKDKTDLKDWEVNLYLHSSDSSTETGADKEDNMENTKKETKKRKREDETKDITTDETINTTADVTTDNTIDTTAEETMNEAEESTSQKKFKWDKMIKSCLIAADDKTLSITKLRKVLLKIYTDQTEEECSAEEFKGKLEKKLSKSTKFTYSDGIVSM